MQADHSEFEAVEDYWFPEELERVGAAPTVRRVGQWLFFSAQVPRSRHTGAAIQSLQQLPSAAAAELSTVEHHDARLGPVKAQTWTIFDNVSHILGRLGCSLDDVIRQRIFLRHARDVPPVEEVLLSFYRDELPATTFGVIASKGLHKDYDVFVEVVALAPHDGGLTRQNVDIAELEAVTRPYPQAVRVGQLLFTSGILGITEQTGRVATNLGVVDARWRSTLVRNQYHTDSSQEPLKAQAALIYSHLEQILGSQGASLADIVRTNFLTSVGDMAAWWAWQPLRQHTYLSSENAPASTALHVPQVTSDPDAVVVCDAVALIPGAWRKGAAGPPEGSPSYLPMAQKAGPFLFTSGLVGFDKASHRATRSFAELTDEGARYLGLSRSDDTEAIMAQAWQAYSAIGQALNAGGSDPSRVLHQSIGMRDLSHYAVLERVAQRFFAGRLPPTTVVGIDDTGPHPHEALFEIDAVAWTGNG